MTEYFEPSPRAQKGYFMYRFTLLLASLAGALPNTQGSRPFEQSITFDPVFSRRERQESEAIHGRCDQ